MQTLKKITTNAFDQQATIDDVDGMWGLRSEGDLEARDGGQVQTNVENALAPSTINGEQVRASVNVVETSITNVVKIEVDLVKIILNIVEQKTIDFIPMLEQQNANEVVDIDRGDILNFTYYN
jgi:hypothetical protein